MDVALATDSWHCQGWLARANNTTQCTPSNALGAAQKASVVGVEMVLDTELLCSGSWTDRAHTTKSYLACVYSDRAYVPTTIKNTKGAPCASGLFGMLSRGTHESGSESSPTTVGLHGPAPRRWRLGHKKCTINLVGRNSGRAAMERMAFGAVGIAGVQGART